MDGKSVYERAFGFEVSETTDGHVLYRDGDEQVLFLNATAAAILELCDGEQTVDEIVRMIAVAYALDHDLRPEVEACLSSLETLEVVVRRR